MNIFNQASGIDKAALRKQRKAVVAYVVWFLVFLNPIVMLFVIEKYSPHTAGSFTIAQLLGIAGLILSIACGIKAFMTLKRLTAILYLRPNRFLTWYTLLLASSLILPGIVPIAMLCVIWFHSRKVLVD